MLLNKLTLRSKKPELVEQELWGALLAESTELLRIVRHGNENADDVTGCFAGQNPRTDARSGKYSVVTEVADKEGKGLPESGKGKAI